MKKLSAWKKTGVVFLFCVAMAVVGPAQTFGYVTFDGPNGAWPTHMSLVQGANGNFYGTTYLGGANGRGNVFEITRAGTLTSLATLVDGIYPEAGLLLATDGNFYGTTSGGNGTIFRITPGGTLTTVVGFDSLDVSRPQAGLIQATDGNIYGTTSFGNGTVFKTTLEGILTTLAVFDGTNAASPQAPLVEATDGNFYGTTFYGGNNACSHTITTCGTVFKVTPGGTLTILHTFTGTDGSFPSAGMVQASDGNLYGTTSGGDPGVTYQGPGTVFRITPDGTLTTLYTFCAQGGCADGANPEGPLVLATDGNFYGTSRAGGNLAPCFGGCGTIFKMTVDGTLTTLYAFNNRGFDSPYGTDGDSPYGGLLQATSGIFYGTTIYGGDVNCYSNIGCGSVFSLDTGLGPFVAFVHAAGKVGQTGGVIGQGFIGTTKVSLNGIPASFTVVSDTFIRATVPAGATTGYVTVTTPSGTLTSNVPFHVIK
jgi:uncharacterized repeat protein (TIGR03803 family)